MGKFDVRAVPRGRRVHTDVWFEDEQGRRVISAVRTSLKPDLNAADKGGAGERATASDRRAGRTAAIE